MCGIVLAGGSSLISRDIELFEKMLICDMFRGEHSTGVMAGYKPVANEPTFVRVDKAAVPGDVFVRSKMWDDLKQLTKTTESLYTKGTFITTKTFPKFLIGHNRYATQGAINNVNAHPFQHGHITLCHNGTLNDQTLLPDHKRFAVDSENVCYAVSEWGIERTIQNLDGAFTLLWYDDNLKTVNIIRNDERPFHLVETSTGDWFGASEEDMIMWLMTRRKYGPTVKRHFECEVGVQYVFDVSNGFKFQEEIKHELPKFTYKWGGYSTSYYSRSYSSYDHYDSSKKNVDGNRSGTGGSQKEKQDNLLAECGFPDLEIGSEVEFLVHRIEPYGIGSVNGKLLGWVANDQGYLEIQFHAFPVDQFNLNDLYTGTICFMFLDGNSQVPTVTVRGIKKVEKDSTLVVLNKDVIEEILPTAGEAFFHEMMSGDRFTKEQWDSRREEKKECCCCSNPVVFETITEAMIDDDGNLYCDSDCYETLMESLYMEGTPKDEDDGYEGEIIVPPSLPKCLICDTTMTPNNTSSKEGVCSDCHKHYYNNGADEKDNMFRKTVNGMHITNKQWNNMNDCKICKSRIPWGLAETTQFIAGSPVCKWCESKLKKVTK